MSSGFLQSTPGPYRLTGPMEYCRRTSTVAHSTSNRLATGDKENNTFCCAGCWERCFRPGGSCQYTTFKAPTRAKRLQLLYLPLHSHSFSYQPITRVYEIASPSAVLGLRYLLEGVQTSHKLALLHQEQQLKGDGRLSSPQQSRR